MTEGHRELVWYVAYGSNLRRARFTCYLSGGRPDGALRTYPGCRDPAKPVAERPWRIRGRLTFSGESTTWTGGMATFHPGPSDTVLALAYLITLDQLSDVVAQEIRQPPGRDLDPSLLDGGGPHGFGAGHYDSVISLGEIDGHRAVTLTAATASAPRAPAAAYLWSIATGLQETFALTEDEVADYLLRARGVQDGWTREQLLALRSGRRRWTPWPAAG